MGLRRWLWLAWAASLPLCWLAAKRVVQAAGLTDQAAQGAALVLSCFIAIAIPLVFYHLKEQRIRRSGIRRVDAMGGQEFEYYLADIFRRAGFSVEKTGASADYGADLLISRDGQTLVVQAKRYHGAVGVAAVQQAAAAQGHYQAQGAMVVTNSRFTRQARSLARTNDVQLWDRGVLFDVATGRKTISR